jgi:hypothetical protein
VALGKEERAELDAHKSDVIHEVDKITTATIRHVEKVIAPFGPLPAKVEEIEKHTVAQTPMLQELKEEAARAKKARIDAKRERIKRSALDENWRKWRKRLAYALATLVSAGEIYHAFFSK